MMQLIIPDMTCGHCEKTIRSALSTLPGIERVEIDLQMKSLRIEGQPDPAAVRHAITEAGYSPQ